MVSKGFRIRHHLGYGEAGRTMSDESPATCIICGAKRVEACEEALVRCNLRRFQGERFRVWRCAECESIHACDEVDLESYYRGYPVFAAELNWMLRVVYGNLLKRLTAAGLRREHRVLDYGCGKGLLVRFLQEQGFAQVHGYDRYAEAYSDPAVLRQRYACIISQDVIEHVADPHALLRSFAGMIEPGGLISIGTPDASALSLKDHENYVHALHQPYHRHILSSRALLQAGEAVGWTVARYDSTMYNNTLVPSMNPRFVLHYLRAHDDVFDLVAETPRVSARLFSPATLFFALFGYFFDRHTDIMVVFKAPLALASSTPA